MFKAGFSRVKINPMMGIGLQGYYVLRSAAGILDDLEINTLAVSSDGKEAVFLSVDHCGIRQSTMDAFRNLIAENNNLPVESVFVSATHTHTAPFVDLNKYVSFKLAQSIV